MSTDESILLLFILSVSWNTGTSLSELSNFISFQDAFHAYQDQAGKLRKLFRHDHPRAYRSFSTFFQDDQSGGNNQVANFRRVMKLLDATSFSINPGRERIPVIVDETAERHAFFSVNSWNAVLGNMTEWIFPGRGVQITSEY